MILGRSVATCGNYLSEGIQEGKKGWTQINASLWDNEASVV
jgi:hypothetical protein